MHVRLRYALPAAQMLLAVGLVWWSDRWFEVQMRLQDMPGPAPAFQLCACINAPVALVRSLCFRHLSHYDDSIALVIAVGALWYWVALNVESWRRDRMVLTFRWAPVRISTDLLLVAMGVLFGCWFVAEGGILSPSPWPLASWLWIAGLLTPLLGWSLALIFSFGRDFIHCIRGRKPAG
jgi:hypothetical protein